MPIVITNKVIEKVGLGYSMNEVLENFYREEIKTRKKEDEIVRNMTPMQMAVYDAGVGKSTTIGEIIRGETLNTGTITTQGATEWLVPAYIDTRLKEIVDKTDILRFLVGTTENESSRVVESAYIDMTTPENKKNARKSRVAEGADLPLARITVGESAIKLFKYGRAVEQTYEALMEMRVNMLNKTLDMIGNDVTNQEVEAAIDVALNGDGNNNAAKSIGTTTTKNKITAEELLNGLVEYWKATKLPVQTIVAGDEMYKELYKMMYNSNELSGLMGKFSFNTPQIPGNSINLIYTDELKVGSNNVIMLLNPSVLTKHVLTGSSIREYQKNIRNQTELGTISEIVGFSKPIPDGVKLITSAS